MNKKRARALHRAMWHWMAKHPGASKMDGPGWLSKNSEINRVFDIGDMCFACWITEELDDKDNTIKNCKMCPIAEKAGFCENKNNLWNKYLLLRLNYEFSEKFNDDEWEDICNRMADAWEERKNPL